MSKLVVTGTAGCRKSGMAGGMTVRGLCSSRTLSRRITRWPRALTPSCRWKFIHLAMSLAVVMKAPDPTSSPYCL